MTESRVKEIEDLLYPTRIYCSDKKIYTEKYNEFIYFYLLSKSHVIKVNGNNVMRVHYNEKLIRELISDVFKINDRRTVINGIRKLNKLDLISDLETEIRIFKNGNQYFLVPNYTIRYICCNYTNQYTVKIFMFLGIKYKIFNENPNAKTKFNFSLQELATNALGMKTTRNQDRLNKIKEALEILKEDGFISYEKIRVNITDKNSKNVCAVEKIQLTKFNPFNKEKLYFFMTKQEESEFLRAKKCE